VSRCLIIYMFHIVIFPLVNQPSFLSIYFFQPGYKVQPIDFDITMQAFPINSSSQFKCSKVFFVYFRVVVNLKAPQIFPSS
jgi:hypothetical protein